MKYHKPTHRLVLDLGSYLLLLIGAIAIMFSPNFQDPFVLWCDGFLCGASIFEIITIVTLLIGRKKRSLF